MRYLSLLAAALLAIAPPTGAQQGAVALGELVRGLDDAPRVLVIAAHPDDEDTQLIAWLARGRQVETAYLSLTRGDGGQNLIGNELGEALGVIRAEELLAARRVDGGRQYFTRAYDFGFSKSADETFGQWSRDSLLADVVTVIRSFRPHVIVSVFSGTARDGHGHHQVAGIIAREAYDAAGDSTRVSRVASGGLAPWTVAKFYRSARFQRESATLAINAGEYSPLAGMSFSEIASRSRSQHKSQGFGAMERKGPVFTYVRREHVRVQAPADAATEQTVFDGIPSLSEALRASGATAAWSDSLTRTVAEVRRNLDFMQPSGAVSHLVRVARAARGAMAAMPCPSGAACPMSRRDLLDRLESIAKRAERAAMEAAGVFVEATVPGAVAAAGSALPVTLRLYNRGTAPVVLSGSAKVSPDSRGVNPGASAVHGAGVTVAPDSVLSIVDTIRLTGPITTPRWLRASRAGAMFRPWCDPCRDAPWELLLGGPDAQPFAVAWVQIAGHPIELRVPLERHSVDPVRGDVRQQLLIEPAVTVGLEREVEYVPAARPVDRRVRVRLRSADGSERAVTVSLRLPAGLNSDSASRSATLAPFGEATVEFRVRGRLPRGSHEMSAVARSGGESFTTGYTTVEYDHIRPQRLYADAATRLEAVDVNVAAGLRVGYIPGVADRVAPMLEQLGVDVTVIDPAELGTVDLSRYRTVVVGPRAYDARPELVAHRQRLLDFARAGGTLVVQYGQYEMQQPGIMPFPIRISRPHTRVTDENAPVRLLRPVHPVFVSPNRIGEADFAGWIQERSLYMPAEFDASYTALLATNDPGETPSEGGLLIAPVGRGTYVYTTMAFFRQLPAGVPGAARLFVNLLSAGGTAAPAAPPRASGSQ